MTELETLENRKAEIFEDIARRLNENQKVWIEDVIRKDERERCALLVESMQDRLGGDEGRWCEQIAAAIRGQEDS